MLCSLWETEEATGLVSKYFSSLLLKTTFTLFSNFPFFSFFYFPIFLLLICSPIAVESHVFSFCIIFLVKMIKRKNVTTIKITRASSYIKGRVLGEFWWWTRSEISKNHRLSCSPSANTRTACPFTLKFGTEFQEILLYKRVSAFFVFVSSSLVLKE